MHWNSICIKPVLVERILPSAARTIYIFYAKRNQNISPAHASVFLASTFVGFCLSLCDHWCECKTLVPIKSHIVYKLIVLISKCLRRKFCKINQFRVNRFVFVWILNRQSKLLVEKKTHKMINKMEWMCMNRPLKLLIFSGVCFANRFLPRFLFYFELTGVFLHSIPFHFRKWLMTLSTAVNGKKFLKFLERIDHFLMFAKQNVIVHHFAWQNKYKWDI